MLHKFLWINFKIEIFFISDIVLGYFFYLPLNILRMRLVYDLLIGVCSDLNQSS